MPLKDCITEGNKIYCWNNETGKVDVYTRGSVSLEKCPVNVLGRLMRLLAEKANKEAGGPEGHGGE